MIFVTFDKNMSNYKVIFALCLLISLGLEIEGRRGGGRGGRRRGWKKSGNFGHPLRNHLNPTWNGYDPFVPPSAANAMPVKVHVNMYLREVGPLNLDDNSFRLQVTMRQEFNDSRLAYRASDFAPEMINLVNEEEIENIWQPDTFVRNERSVQFHDALAPNRYLRVYPDGRVKTSQRVTLQLSCPRLKSQLEETNEAKCFMDIASYGYHETAIAYAWKEDKPIQVTEVNQGFLVPKWAGRSMREPTTSRCDVKTSTGKYSCIRLQLVFVQN